MAYKMLIKRNCNGMILAWICGMNINRAKDAEPL